MKPLLPIFIGLVSASGSALLALIYIGIADCHTDFNRIGCQISRSN